MSIHPVLLSEVEIPKDLEKWVKLQDMLEDISHHNIQHLADFIINSFPEQVKSVKHQLKIYANIRPSTLHNFIKLQNELNKSEYFVDTVINLNESHDEIEDAIKEDDINTLVNLASLNEDILKNGLVTNICLAATYGAVKCFRYFLIQSTPDSRLLAVHSASASGNAEILRLLQQEGTPIAFGLEDALNGRQNHIADWLMTEYEADICGIFDRSKFNIRASLAVVQNALRCNPPHVAASMAIFAAASSDIPEFLEFLLSMGASPQCVGPMGTTPLHAAAAAGAEACVEALLKAGADPNARARYMTPFDVASNDEIKLLLQKAME